MCYRNFLSPYDGLILYTVLDQITRIFLSNWMVNEKKSISSIKNCLILISNDIAKVYINIPTIAVLISKRSIKKGEALTREDIADIRKIQFKDIEIELNSGIVYIFSLNWMKCVYFDHSPMLPKKLKHAKQQESCKEGDLESLFASFYSYIMFPEVFRLESTINEKILEKGWFPFIRILGWRFEEIYNNVKNDFDIYNAEMKIVDFFDEKMIHNMIEDWVTKDIFKNHEKIIRTGIERYLEKDFISAIHVLYPRIEGIMRHIFLGTTERSSQNNLVDKLTAVAEENNPDSCLFIPNNFSDYLKRFYFNNFDLEKGDLDISRNTIGHGIAKEEDFDKIKAFQAILILDQMFFYV